MTEADIIYKPLDWFLYDIGLRHEGVKAKFGDKLAACHSLSFYYGFRITCSAKISTIFFKIALSLT